MSDYRRIIEKVFHDRYQTGATEVRFRRDALATTAAALNLDVPKNLGDVIYSFRYRRDLPASIAETAHGERHWVIEGRGQAEYAFVLMATSRIVPNPSLLTIKIPDATPEIVLAHAMTDEQALLAKVRYNRLIDVFLGVSAYSLQNHLRTAVADIGQIEIDEIYVAVDSRGRQFVLPVQAKGAKDQLSVVQSKQDIKCCAAKYPRLICRPIATQFTDDERIALFELVLDDAELKVVTERHYKLVPSAEISEADMALYRNSATDTW